MATHTLIMPASRRAETGRHALNLNTRPRIEAAIERLIAVLDEIDGDPDREPDDRIPYPATVQFDLTPLGRRMLAEGAR